MLVLLLCTAFFSVRMVGDHLHLCFDGSEPSVSLHGADGEIEHEPGIAGGHHDVNLDLFHASLTKSNLDPIALIGLFCIAFLATLAPVKERWTPPATELLSTSLFRYFRPPLRGPPTTRS